MVLHPEEQLHVDATRKWTGYFRIMTKRYGVPRWRFDPWTVALLKAIRAKDLPSVADYCKRRDGVLFASLNKREKKRVVVIPTAGGDVINSAYISTWDPGYANYPDLTFIVVDAQLVNSLAEFDDLFKRFIQAQTQKEIDAFKKYVYRQYKYS